MHFSKLGEIDVQQGNFAIGDDIGADYLERKRANRKNLQGSFTVHLEGRPLDLKQRPAHENGVFVPVQVDITEIKAYEAQMEDARRQAETASQAKKEFLATMSYELRTPLTSIYGSLGLIAGALSEN